MSSTESVKKDNVKEVKQYELSLGGHALTISSDQNPQRVEQIAKMADSTLQQLLSKNYTFQKSLMIALLQMSEEILDLKSNLQNQIEEVEQKAQKVVVAFEKALTLE